MVRRFLEVRVALGFGFGAGVFNAGFTDDAVVTNDVPFDFVSDEWQCFGRLPEREGLDRPQ